MKKGAFKFCVNLWVTGSWGEIQGERKARIKMIKKKNKLKRASILNLVMEREFLFG